MVCYNITAYNEIINFTVSKREVYYCKLRAGIKAERGMVMKGKNLERAVILGLLLSTGVYGTAWAEDYSGEKTEGITVNQGANDSHTVNGDVNFTLGDTAWITNNGGKLTITGGEGSSLDVATNADSAISNSNGETTINTDEDIKISANWEGGTGHNVYTINQVKEFANSGSNSKVEIKTNGAVEIRAESDTSYGSAINSAVFYANGNIETVIEGDNVKVIANTYEHGGSAAIMLSNLASSENKNTILITGNGTTDNFIKSYTSDAINVAGNGISDTGVVITSNGAGNVIEADDFAISAQLGYVNLEAKTYNKITSTTSEDVIRAWNYGNVVLNAEANEITATETGTALRGTMAVGKEDNTLNKYKYLNVTATKGSNTVTAYASQAIKADDGYKISLTATNGDNIVYGYKEEHPSNYSNREAISVENAAVELNTNNKNTINAGIVQNVNKNGENVKVGQYNSLEIIGNDNNYVSTANFTAGVANEFYGAIVVQGKSNVEISSNNNTIGSNNRFSSGYGYAYAIIADGESNLTGENRTEINVTATNGGTNTIFSNGYDNTNTHNERAVFATEGGVVNINGSSIITADSWTENNADDYQANNTASALIAGTYDWNNAEKDDEGNIIFNVADDERSVINLNYGNGSAVTGDIAAGYAGAVNIIGQSADGIITFANDGEETVSASNSLQLNGNVLAANGGKVKLELGKGSVWHGRADDYQDAAENSNWGKEHLGEFEPVFSNGIQEAGTVDVTLKDGATWDVMGQSWLTTLDGTGGVIDMRNTNGDASRTSHAVHIGDLTGSHTFVMDLDTNHTVSDMLYIKGEASGEQKLWINSIEGLEKLEEDGEIRFATVNSANITFSGNYNFGSYENAKNGILLADNGVLDNAFVIKKENYTTTDVDNAGYNGTDFNETKPGEGYINDNYGEGSFNWLLAKDSSGDKVSDAGKTIINMSRANYKNAIYMDRLNKRMGEMRYVNGEEEQGLWVRLRHDRIGQSGDFRSMNTMYEVGYDVKQPTDNGEHRIGMAIDYMRGSTTYDDIMGKGETKRYGLWLYDTWLGEKGHYVDYVAKWGHLSNDFDITAKTTGEEINGDYSNNVFSVSAEYGKKNDMGNNWYFEPQAQLQLARVTGADYVTTQGSKVNVDGINSLIGRAGFRIGRDMDENSTVYLKADLLHEFMGDQTVTAADATGTLREEFENKGTWYDVGFGFAAKMSKNSYAFMDFEKSFGNDNDETYQINAGMQWTF